MALYANIKGPVNYTAVGSPTIENGIASGFSSSDYLTLNLDKNVSNINEYVFKFKLSSEGLRDQYNYIFRRGNFQLSIYGSTNLTFSTPYMYLPTYNQNIPLTGFAPIINTWYWIKYTYNGTVVNLYSSTDGINYILRNTVENVIVAGNSGTFYIGFADTNVNSYFGGEIDLNNSYVNINGNAWFGTSFSKVKLHSQSAITYTKVGNVSITDDGVATGFTDKTDYLTLPAFNPGTSKWKFTTKVKIYSYSTQISLIDRNSSTRCFQIVVRTTGKFRVNISTNGSSKANEVDGTHVLSVNTIYYICFEYDGSKYYLKYSLDNINWVTDITINNSTKIYPVSSMCMGHSWYNSGTEKWDGEIYLRWTRFEIDGVTNDKCILHCLEGS